MSYVRDWAYLIRVERPHRNFQFEWRNCATNLMYPIDGTGLNSQFSAKNIGNIVKEVWFNWSTTNFDQIILEIQAS